MKGIILPSSFQTVLALLLPLFLTQCGEATQAKKQYEEAGAKLAALQNENNEMESKLITLRRALPPASTPLEAAKRVILASESELSALDTKIKQAAADITATEAAIAQNEQELQSLRTAAKP